MSGENLNEFAGYQVLRRIGVGGTAEVFEAVRKNADGFEHRVALKIMLPGMGNDHENSLLFKDEAKLLTLLRHPNIISVFDFGQVNGQSFLAMEYIDGINVSQLLYNAQFKNEDIPIDLVTFIILQISRALDHAHRFRFSDSDHLGIIHRDVTPQNILISKIGEVKLTDFGIAKTTMSSTRTESGVVRGKFQYMSPEQAAAKSLTFASDQYSLGIVFLELLTGMNVGHLLISKGTTLELSEIRASSYRSDLPLVLDNSISTLLTKDPSKRFLSCRELSETLSEYLGAKKLESLPDQLASYVQKILKDDKKLNDSNLIVLSNITKKEQRSQNILHLCLLLLLLLGSLVALYIKQMEKIEPPPVAIIHIPTPTPFIPTQAPSPEFVPVVVEKEVRPKPTPKSKPKPTPTATPSPTPIQKAEVKHAFVAPTPIPAVLHCDPGMIEIPTHSFTYGSEKSDPDRNDLIEALASKTLVLAYCIDKFEFPNQEGVKPQTNVSFVEAKNYCAKVGKRLCKGEEWESACKGPRSHAFPYGDAFVPKNCNVDRVREGELASNGGLVLPNNISDLCASDYGVFNLSGNVEEWVDSSGHFDATTYVARGGSVRLPSWASRCSSIREVPLYEKLPTLGFRCCKELGL